MRGFGFRASRCDKHSFCYSIDEATNIIMIALHPTFLGVTNVVWIVVMIIFHICRCSAVIYKRGHACTFPLKRNPGVYGNPAYLCIKMKMEKMLGADVRLTLVPCSHHRWSRWDTQTCRAAAWHDPLELCKPSTHLKHGKTGRNISREVLETSIFSPVFIVSSSTCTEPTEIPAAGKNCYSWISSSKTN